MKGDLDDSLIVRFAHSYSSIGGLSHHLIALNRILLQRNRADIHQAFPVREREQQTEPAAIPSGLGVFHYLPIPLKRGSGNRTAPGEFPRSKPIPSGRAPRTGLIAKARGMLGAVLYDSRWIRVTRHLPGLSRGADHRLEVPDALSNLLPKIRDRHPGRRCLYVDHSPHSGYAALRLLAARRAGFTPVAIYHGGFTSEAARALRALPRGIACGAVTLLGHSGELGERPCRLANGIDTTFFDPALSDRSTSRQQFGILDHETALLLPASLMKAKGHLELIEAVQLLHQRHEWTHTVVLFAGAERQPEFRIQLEEATRDAAATTDARFVVTNHLTSEALRQAYAASDLVVLPSHSEGLSRVLLEAQAMGIPVVATDVGGSREAMIDGKTGRLVPLGNPAALADALQRMKVSISSGLHSPSAARDFVHDHYGLDALAERHERFYLECMQRHA